MTRAIAVVAHRADAAATALAALLRRRGRCETLLIDETAIARATVIHRPGSGPAEPGCGTSALPGDALRLPEGTVLDAQRHIVVWRLPGFPIGSVAEPHLEYAAAEAFALGLSWLTGLGDAALNRPDPTHLGGAQPHLLGLVHLAAAAGLSTPAFEACSNAAAADRTDGLIAHEWTGEFVPLHAVGAPAAASGPPVAQPALRIGAVGSPTTALVLDGTVTGPAPSMHERIADLARRAGLRCAEVSLAIAAEPERLVVTGVNPIPSLTGPGQLAMLAGFLEELAGATQEAAA